LAYPTAGSRQDVPGRMGRREVLVVFSGLLLATLLAVAVALAIALPEKPPRGRTNLAADEAGLDGKTTSRTARSRHAEGIG
jgi:hypothetical protein